MIEGIRVPLWKRNLFIVWFGCFATTSGMSLIMPFLPLYIEQLGIRDTAAVEQWAGITFGATFLMSAIVSPLWGKLADLKGRKLMLLRASLGMAIICTAMGFVQHVWQLAALRFLMGAVSGYIAAAITLVATQTPREQSGWALGTLNTGTVGGSLVGPLLGGYLADVIGLRNVFYFTGLMMFIAFIITLLFVREQFTPNPRAQLPRREVWKLLPNPRLIWAMMITTFILQLANMSIQPIVTVYVKILLGGNHPHIALIAGTVVATAGIANVLAAPWLGRLSDRVGPHRVLLVCLIITGILFIPQAFVHTPWQLMGLRFLMGLAMAGQLPSINAIVRKNAPGSVSGRVFGYNQSAQYLGNIGGSVMGGQMAAYFGIRSVFFSTSLLLLLNALWVYWVHRPRTRPSRVVREATGEGGAH